MGNKYKVFVSNSARKSIAKIPLPWQVRVLEKLTDLEVDPYAGDKMEGKMKGNRKLRVWPYRIIYRIDEKLKWVKIMEVGHRGNISYD
jgi:addiction module RelE/StbE family toxin